MRAVLAKRGRQSVIFGRVDTGTAAAGVAAAGAAAAGAAAAASAPTAVLALPLLPLPCLAPAACGQLSRPLQVGQRRDSGRVRRRHI